ncbi:hypothetical protein Tco_0364289 [Tanacetum coccineum]
MSTPKFAETHNLVAFLEKPKESNGFEGIIDFLNASSIKYALTVNPTVYESCIQQFWATAKAKTVNEERQIQALVDKKKVIITEKSVRSDLMLEDAEGTECLPNDVIFEQLTLMGAKTTAWNEFSSTMASAIILIMESLVKMKQKGAILELKRIHLKKIIFCTYTPYPSMKIRRISASSAQETRNDQFPIRRIHYNQYAVCTAVHQSKIRI